MQKRNGCAPTQQDNWQYTYYVRDAQGNVMATYSRSFKDNAGHTQVTDQLALGETDLYGSARLGLKDRTTENLYTNVVYGYSGFNADNSFDIGSSVGSAAMIAPDTVTPKRMLGSKAYELVNHLGNVLVTVSDRKLLKQHSSSATIDYYTADVKATSDYSAFGAPLEGRLYNNTTYRYGFNGKEDDAETVGTGEGTQDYGMRIYNSSLGRFLSSDPMTSKFPMLTPYQFASNTPIEAIDLDGMEAAPVNPSEQHFTFGQNDVYLGDPQTVYTNPNAQAVNRTITYDIGISTFNVDINVTATVNNQSTIVSDLSVQRYLNAASDQFSQSMNVYDPVRKIQYSGNLYFDQDGSSGTNLSLTLTDDDASLGVKIRGMASPGTDTSPSAEITSFSYAEGGITPRTTGNFAYFANHEISHYLWLNHPWEDNRAMDVNLEQKNGDCVPTATTVLSYVYTNLMMYTFMTVNGQEIGESLPFGSYPTTISPDQALVITKGIEFNYELQAFVSGYNKHSKKHP